MSVFRDAFERGVGLDDELLIYEGLDTEQLELLWTENDVVEGEQLLGFDFFERDEEVEAALNLADNSDDFFNPWIQKSW